MIPFLLQRTLLLSVTLCLLIIISFSISWLPSDAPLESKPFFDALKYYLTMLSSGDLGTSSVSEQSILEQLLEVFPATIELALLSFIVALALGIPLGVLSGLLEDSFIDRFLRVFSLIGFSLPVLWLGLLLILFFSLTYESLPLSGRLDWRYEIPYQTGFLFFDLWQIPNPLRQAVIEDMFKHLLLPVITLTLAPLAEITYLVRNNCIEINNTLFVRAAKTRRISSFALIRRHILPNAIPQLIPRFGSLFSSMLTMAIITEYVFTWPGIGRWLINSIRQDDYGSISAGVLAIGLFVIIVNTLTNIFAVLLSPSKAKEWQTLG
ncbi:ABC transporter permease subunit [Thorsellia anophelis]|uniref:Cationic peptide transport system permease protein n=1 Tax=Thorsellia anophelis DSM 18579 TaxID=1123402 RepID=A0A1I0EN14_9GAMM|nr:ABC transporter permease subunit [Thorsellia anophelis]SET46657.1 cationic peptide transport system permease protein [Thorsellia anophelis DSM 18579]